MKPILYCSIFILFVSSAVGQVQKTYSGRYEKGYAVYQYYENENYERILNGNFSYKESELQISGQYRNNLRNGLWKTTTSVSKGWDKNSQIISEFVSATYINGQLEGLCTYKKTNETTKRTLVTAIASFRKNMMVGDYKFESYGDKYESDNKFSINYYLTNEGFIDGTLKINYSYNGVEYEDIQKYKTGFLYWALCRNTTNGKVLKKINKQSFVDEFYSNYDTIKKVSIIPYSEFPAGDNEPKYLSDNEENPIEIPNELGERKNLELGYYDDTVFYKNAPFTFIRAEIRCTEYETTSSYWNLKNGINFWNNCENCNHNNPLYYRFKNGTYAISFLPVKDLALDDVLYKQMLLEKN